MSLNIIHKSENHMLQTMSCNIHTDYEYHYSTAG